MIALGVMIDAADPHLHGASSNGRSRGTVLLVDDDQKFRQLLHEFLELKGYTVATAATGEEMLERLSNLTPAVVLLDVMLPGMDGILAFKHLRLLRPNLPVIFITNTDSDRTREEAVTLGSNEYLLKPFSFDYLETILLTRIFN